MHSGYSPLSFDRQTPDFGMGESPASTQPSELSAIGKGLAKNARADILFDAFVSSVERLERLIDRETVELIEHRPAALDDFNHKKRHGLLELSRAMEAMRGLDRDCLGHDPKALLARLRVKLQKNLKVLQTHLDAVGAIAAIIARAIHEHESDGTYTPELSEKGRPR